ncbi:MAG: hypothetical protein KUG77_25410 [Nannocystaceae bacterium]|nr:hypothetical protein [Nannocystaceae bacterium]
MSQLESSLSIFTFCMLIAAGGCGEGLPPYEKVAEHRILSAPVRVTGPYESPPVREGFTRAEAFPGETVQVRPFAVSQEGIVDPGDLDLRWIACELFAGRGALGCLSQAFPTQLDRLPECDFQTLEVAVETGPRMLASPCVLPPGAVAEFAVPVSNGVLSGADIELTAVGSTPGGTPSEDCAADFLAGKGNVPDDCLYAVQVVDLVGSARLFEWAGSVGLETDGVAPVDPTAADETDLHPHISSFRVGVQLESGADPDLVDIPLGGEFIVRAGQTIRIEVASPEDELQDFSVAVNDGTQAEAAREAYAGQWFITWGSLLSADSQDPASFNEWTLQAVDDDAQEPAGGVAYLYYVVRDGRNGASHWWFSLRFDA